MQTSERRTNDYILLNSCGIEYLNNDIRQIRKNGRVDYHILYIYRGCCYIKKHATEIPLKEGNMIVYRPGERQEYRFVGADASVSCYLHFTGTGCEALIDKLELSEYGTAYIGINSDYKKLMEKMVVEFAQKKANYEEMCNAFLMELLARAMRKAYYAKNPNAQKRIKILDKALLLMHERYAENIPMSVYADCCNLSLSRFAHLFSDTLGIAPHSYITKLRLDKAGELLVTTEKSINEISEQLGFVSQSYFSAMFKKYMGCPPLKYRKENR